MHFALNTFHVAQCAPCASRTAHSAPCALDPIWALSLSPRPQSWGHSDGSTRHSPILSQSEEQLQEPGSHDWDGRDLPQAATLGNPPMPVSMRVRVEKFGSDGCCAKGGDFHCKPCGRRAEWTGEDTIAQHSAAISRVVGKCRLMDCSVLFLRTWLGLAMHRKMNRWLGAGIEQLEPRSPRGKERTLDADFNERPGHVHIAAPVVCNRM